MALIYFIRHGKPDYSQLEAHGFFGFGRAFAPLSPEGIRQAELTAKDPRLLQAKQIVSSPYTRALQTAQIISRETSLPVTVDLDLHEWMPDQTNRLASSEESAALAQEFAHFRGVYPQGQTMRWESLAHMRARMRRAADRYAGDTPVIFVGHGMAFRALCEIDEMAPAEIIVCEYHSDQPDCLYHFK